MVKTLKKNEKGFTLVELVVVIAILAILAALLVPRIMGNVGEAKKSKEEANARTIASEISTHNALVKVSGGTAITAGTHYKGSPDVTTNDTKFAPIKRGDKDLPDGAYAKIVIDSDGNATVTGP